MIRRCRLEFAGAARLSALALCCFLGVTGWAPAAGPALANTAPKAAAKAKPAAAEKVDPATIVAGADTVETDAEFTWVVNLEVQNPAETGLYLDSLFCDAEDIGPGATRAERTTRIDLTALAKLNPEVSGGGGVVIQHSGPAAAESARLRYTVHAHRSTGKPITRSVLVIARPGTSTTFESKHFESGGKPVEYVLVPARPDLGNHPGILLVHGHGNHARHTIRFARQLASRGYTLMLVSMPGYGTSAGPADLMGPATVAALDRALDTFRATPGVDTSRIAVWGLSRGATAAAALAARRADIDAVVLQAGIYDLWATYRGTRIPGFPEAIVAEAGTDSAAWRARSPILSASTFRAPVLILHGEKDTNVPVAQARAFENALRTAGRTVESKYLPTQAHQISGGEAFRLSLDFLKRQLAK